MALLVVLLATAHASMAGDLAIQVVRGRVVDLEGRPVSGAHVVISARDAMPPGWASDAASEPSDPVRLLERYRAEQSRQVIRDLGTTESRSDGTFEARLTPPLSGGHIVTATATASDGSASGTTGAIPVRPGTRIGGIGRSIGHELHYPAPVHEGVVDLGLVLARPLARLGVEVRRGGSLVPWTFVRFKRPRIGLPYDVLIPTEGVGVAMGTFPAGPIVVAVHIDMERRGRPLVLNAMPGEQIVPLELSASTSELRGSVVDANGRPVGGAIVTATQAEPHPLLEETDLAQASTRSHDGGGFLLLRVPNEPVVLVAEVPETSRRSMPVTVAPGTNPVLVLAAEGTVEFDVPTGVTHVYDVRADGFLTERGFGHAENVVRKDRLRVDVPVGRVHVVGSGQPNVFHSTPVFLVERGQLVRCGFEPGVVVTGRVVDANGHGREAALDCRSSDSGRAWDLGVTEADGDFVVTLPAGFELRAEGSAFWTSVERVLQYSPWVRAEGRDLELRNRSMISSRTTGQVGPPDARRRGRGG